MGKASTSCKRAESLDTTLAAVHLCLGMVLKGTGENDLAVQELDRAIEIDPTSDDAVRELAEALQQQGKARDAEAAYRRSIEIRPQSWLAYDRLGIFYSNQGRYAEAATAFEQVIQLAPDGYQGYNNLGGIYLAQGKYDRAVPLLMRSAAVLPTSTAYSNLGAAYVYMKRFDDAVAAYQKAVSEPEAGFDEWGNLAEAYYYGLRDQQRAIETYKKAIALANEQLKVNARDPQLLSSLGLYKALTKERDSALYYSRQALAVASSNNEVLFNVAKTETILGDNEQALNYLAKAIANGYSKYYAKDDPVFGDLRLDPRFSRLVGEP